MIKFKNNHLKILKKLQGNELLQSIVIENTLTRKYILRTLTYKASSDYETKCLE